MGFDRISDATLSFPAVAREQGEALSSWLARIAKRHLLELDHVAEEIGCPVQAVDYGPPEEVLARIAVRTGAGLEEVEAALHPLASSADRPQHGELDWRVCTPCLELGAGEGRVPYIRTAWTYPLTTVCVEHRAPLTIPTIEQFRSLLPDDVHLPRQDIGLRCIDHEPVESLIRAASMASTSTSLDVLAREVRDLIDALSVQINFALGRGAALTLFEHPRRGRHISPLSLDLPDGQLVALDPADRLLFVRAALALRWPSQGFLQEREVLGDWFSRVVVTVVPKGRRRVIGDHAMDPLGLLAVALPVKPFHRLRQRAAHWSPELRARWASAEQLAALSGLN